MPFIPHTQKEIDDMLQVIGVTSIEQLFSEIPEALKLKKKLDLESGMNEMQVSALLQSKAKKNKILENYLGAGSYEHYIPACVWDIATRGEYMTAYTPYQAEASQGSLQLIWEYQSMMASLMALPVSNASMYDGATALAEAILMALRSRRKDSMKVWIPMNLNPNDRMVLDTLLKPQAIELFEIPYHLDTGCLCIAELENLYRLNSCDVFVIAQPNFFGAIESVDTLTNWAHDKGAMVVAKVNPIAMSLIKPPGEWGENGVDIACGEGQPLGVPLSYGGPYFGFLCCQMALVRQLPGRLVGRTVDKHGKTGFTLTLQAREQHIRRGKATSNICTNQGLLVVAATIYMSVMGPVGLKKVAENSYQQSCYLLNKLLTLPGVSKVFSNSHFNEFVIRLPKPVKSILESMRSCGIQAGYDLGDIYPELDNTLLICVTEIKTKEQLDNYYDALKKILA